MSRQSLQSVSPKILQVAFGLLLLVAFALSVKTMMSGSLRKTILPVVLCFGTAIVFLLDDKYWLLGPFLALSGLSLPRLPFDGQELGCLVLVCVYFPRLALGKAQSIRFDRDLFIVFPLLLWIVAVWVLTPVGLAMFGSETIGGRFYFRIAIGFLSLLVLSTLRPNEHDAQLLFYAMMAALLCNLSKGIIFPGTDPDAIVFDGDVPERSQRYAFVTCSTIYTLLFARHSLSKTLSSPFRIAEFVILGLLTIYSGKRRAVGTLALVPILRMALTGRERLLTAVMGVVAAFFLLFLVVGDGVVYRLPNSARRSLSIIAPKYNRAEDNGGVHDLFRQEMRLQAREVIKNHPWVGRKGFAMNLNETSWILFGGGRTSYFAGHAYAGNWHSAWYAYAADFGIPCLCFWVLFAAYLVRYSFRAARTVVVGTWLPACCLFFILLLLNDLFFAYTSGHSANTSLEMWTRYGLLLAVVRGYKSQTRNLVA